MEAPTLVALARVGPTLSASLAREVRWLGAWGGLLLALTVAPYLVASFLGPADLVRTGTFWFYEDFSQYLAAMRQGATSSSWLIHNQLTAEPHQPILMYPLYVALGKLAAAARLDLMGIYYAAEVVGRVLLVVALYQFVALFAPLSARRIAFLLSAFSLGLMAWLIPARLLLLPFGASGWLDGAGAAINIYLEVNTLGVFLAGPHLMLGLALTLLIPRPYLAIAHSGLTAARGAALVSLCLLLALLHPFNLPVVLSVLGLHAALARTLPGAISIVLAGLAGAPLLAYQAAVFRFDPLWSQTYGAQNVMPSPSLISLPIDFGVVLLLAPIGVWVLRRKLDSPTIFLLVWCGLALAWMYAPVPFQRRLGFGVQPGLAVLAAVGLLYWYRHLQHHPWKRRALSYSVLVLAANTTVLVYVSLIASALHNQPVPVYAWTTADARAASWLAERSTDRDVVLASARTGNTLAGVIPGRVVYGHSVATHQALEKEQLVGAFFSGGASMEQLDGLLAESNATYVYYGPRERQLGDVQLERLTALGLVYAEDDVEIYLVRGR